MAVSKVFLTRTPTGWQPYDDDCREVMRRFKIGEVHQIDLKLKRNHKFNALYHVLLKQVFQNQEFFKELKAMKEFIRLETGCFDTVEMPDKSIRRITRSPSFDEVDDDIEFDQDYFQPTIQAGLLLVVGATEEELRHRVDEILRFA